jgi:hypothetical protein
MIITKTVEAGIYGFDFEKTGNVVAVVVRNPDGALVANSGGSSMVVAARNVAATAGDEALRLIVNKTVFPEF